MFHLEIGIKLGNRPRDHQGSSYVIVPHHPGFEFSGSLRHIFVIFTEYPGEFGYRQDLWDALMSLPDRQRPLASPWQKYAERFAAKMTRIRWAQELRNATSAEHTIVIPKNGMGGNF